MAVIKELDLCGFFSLASPVRSLDKSCHVVLLGQSDRSGTVRFLSLFLQFEYTYEEWSAIISIGTTVLLAD